MAVTSTNRLAGPFSGNGTTTVFSFDFKVFSTADLFVLVVDGNGTASALVLDTDYTAVLNGNQDTSPGGSVTLAAALATGSLMTITSSMEGLQQLVLTNLGGFFPDVLNTAFDRLTILAQQIQQAANQSLKLELTDDFTSAQLPPAVSRANSFLTFDAKGAVAVAPLIEAPIDYVTALFTGAATKLPGTAAPTAALTGSDGHYALTIGVPVPTVSVGTTTTGAPGSSAAVHDSGASGAPVLNFTVPQGPAGAAGPPTTFLGAYNPATTYAIGQAVSYAGSSYVSLVSGNIGNTPNTSPSSWGLQAAAGPPTTFLGPYNAGTTYAAGQAVSYTDGSSYVSLQAANVGHEPDTSPSWWGVLAKVGQAGASGIVGIPIYSTAADGVTPGTGAAVGGYFYVPAATSDGLYDVWKNAAGSAVLQSTIPPQTVYPSNELLVIEDAYGFGTIVIDENDESPLLAPQIATAVASALGGVSFLPGAVLTIEDDIGFAVDEDARITTLEDESAALSTQVSNIIANPPVPRPAVGPVAASSMWAVAQMVDAPPAGTGSQGYDTIQGMIPYYMPRGGSELQVILQNATTSFENLLGPDCTVTMSLEYPVGNFQPFCWNGQPTLTLTGRSTPISDELGVDVPPGGVAYLHFQYVKLANQPALFPAGYYFGVLQAGSLGSLVSPKNSGASWDALELLRTRSVSDFVFTSGSTTATSATGAFEKYELNQTITDPTGTLGWPNNKTTYSYASGNTITLAAAPTSSHSGYAAALSATNKTTGAFDYAYHANTGTGQTYGPCPLTIVGRAYNPALRFLLFGNSITWAVGANSTIRGSWAVLGLNYAFVNTAPSPANMAGVCSRFPISHTALPGEQCQFAVANHSTRYRAASGCDFALGMFCTNDAYAGQSSAQMSTSLLALAAIFRARGPKMILGTVIPRTTSATLNWGPGSDQVVQSFEPQRLDLIAWERAGMPIDPLTGLRVPIGTSGAIVCNVYSASGSLIVAGTGTHPVHAVIDLCQAIDPPNTGLWRTDLGSLTLDGTHPNPTGHMLMASVVNASIALFTA